MFKLILLTTILGIVTMANADTLPIDTKKLESYRKETIVSGNYLKIWNILNLHLNDKNVPIKVDEYLITFNENDDEYVINFDKPMTKLILGGGNGVCRINKVDTNKIECKFQK